MTDHSEPRHPIRIVAQRTGLTPATLRAWERRYGVVDPDRSGGGQRLYSDADVERLNRMRMLTEAGRAISLVAELSDEEARELLTEDREAAVAEPPSPVPSSEAGSVVDEAFEQVRAMHAPGLESVLRRSAVTLGAVPFLELVLTPLFYRIGTAWAAGNLGPAEEHLATQVAERVLAWLTDPTPARNGAPRIVVATLPGERHGLGVELVSATAALEGWSVVSLGVDLPPRDIASGARRVDADVVAVSMVNPDLIESSLVALRDLRKALADDVRVLVGGSASARLAAAAFPPGVERIVGLADLRSALSGTVTT